MNRYGKLAQETWKTTAPKQYALIPNPEEWFQKLGEEAEQRVAELSDELAGPDPQNESFLDKYGRLTAAKNQAEEIVRTEMLTPEDLEQEGDEDPENESSSEMFEIIQSMNHGYQDLLQDLNADEAEQSRSQH
ncbi:hypothetical protein [Arthrobacter luteolus]|uniref:hypothetical protein n=1 Tax=Arthrobacter luteolus TaxID=98672 RepID=UPI0008327B31|nr:hypothetical protein [Arthrobacter luteolus]